jgi:arylsulfatase A
MKLNLRSVLGLIALSLAAAAALNAGAAPASKPNIVLILADDLGWSDLGCYGADLHETPHLDRLAREGMRFTDAYAMPVCSPSRGALLTGRHAARLHITIWSEGAARGPQNRKLLQGDSRPDLPHTEKTLARYLQSTGYLTALVGKWHLGGASHFPETHGFDVNIGGTHWGAPQTFWWPYRGSGRYVRDEFRYVPHLEFGQPNEYLTDRLTDEAIKVIAQARGKPFFLFLAHHAPHTPIEAKPAEVKYFEAKLKPGLHHQNAVYAAMVHNLDQNVGRVLDHLRTRGLADNTLVVFASDNGGFIGVDRPSGNPAPVTSNHPLRSGKGSCYEGGIRVPLLIRWPGVARPGTECREPIILMDLFATLLAASGTQPAPDVKLDGLDLRPVLQNPSATLPRDALFFHYPHYYETTTPVSAVRARDWKLLEYFEDNRVELFNLRDDPGEKTDVARQLPAKAQELRQHLNDWRVSVDAALPKSNPGYQAKKK